MLNEVYAKGMSMTKDASRKSYVFGPLMHDFLNKYLLSETDKIIGLSASKKYRKA